MPSSATGCARSINDVATGGYNGLGVLWRDGLLDNSCVRDSVVSPNSDRVFFCASIPTGTRNSWPGRGSIDPDAGGLWKWPYMDGFGNLTQFPHGSRYFNALYADGGAAAYTGGAIDSYTLATGDPASLGMTAYTTFDQLRH